eukprot:Rmarinus@m.614
MQRARGRGRSKIMDLFDIKKRGARGQLRLWFLSHLFGCISISRDRRSHLSLCDGSIVYVCWLETWFGLLLLRIVLQNVGLAPPVSVNGDLYDPFASLTLQAACFIRTILVGFGCVMYALGKFVQRIPLVGYFIWPFFKLFVETVRITNPPSLNNQRERLQNCLSKNAPVVVFLRRPSSWFVRTAIEAGFFVSSQEFENHVTGLFADLCAYQRGQPHPSVNICPIAYATNRAHVEDSPLWDAVFGSREAPGVSRELLDFLYDRRPSLLRGGPLISVPQRQEEHPTVADSDLAVQLRDEVDTRIETELRVVCGRKLRPHRQLLEIVLKTSRVQQEINNEVNSSHVSRKKVERRALSLVSRMASHPTMAFVRGLNIFLNYAFYHLFGGIHVDEAGLERIRKVSAKAPVVYLPTHKSHADYLILSYVLYHYDLALPHIAAGDNLNIPLVGTLFRRCGAFFIRRSFRDDPLYAAIAAEFVKRLLVEGRSIEFFVEGGRSRSGKVGQPKMGMLKFVTEAILSEQVPDAYVVPISIDYTKVIETASYSSQLLGNVKQKESLSAVLKLRKLLNLDFGHVTVHFAKPISLASFIKSTVERCSEKSSRPFDPVASMDDRRNLVGALAHRVVADINSVVVTMPTTLIATILLTYSARAISKTELMKRVLWLRGEILSRGGQVSKWHDSETEHVVTEAIGYLGPLLKMPKKAIEPMLRPRESRRLELSYYRNQVLRLFIEECIIVCALKSILNRAEEAQSVLTSPMTASPVSFERTESSPWVDTRIGDSSDIDMTSTYQTPPLMMHCTPPRRDGHTIKPAVVNISHPPRISQDKATSFDSSPGTPLDMPVSMDQPGVFAVVTKEKRLMISEEALVPEVQFLVQMMKPELPFRHVDLALQMKTHQGVFERLVGRGTLHYVTTTDQTGRQCAWYSIPEPGDHACTLAPHSSDLPSFAIPQTPPQSLTFPPVPSPQGPSPFSGAFSQTSAPPAHAICFFLCALVWPLIDSYWVVGLSLLSLIGPETPKLVPEQHLLQRAQQIAETLFQEGTLCYCEAVSLEALTSSMSYFVQHGVISREYVSDSDSIRTSSVVRLLPPYTEESNLSVLIDHIGSFRRLPVQGADS